MSLHWTSSTSSLDWEALAALYREAGLSAKTAAGLQLAFDNSRHVHLLYDDGQLIGAGRALGDGIYIAYVCDIALLPAYQGRGLGQEIVRRLLDDLRGHQKVILYAVPGKEVFYEQFGFRKMRTAMALFENAEAAYERGYLENG